MMRPSAFTVANLAAWVALAGLFGAAVVVADRLGFFGLVVLGLLVWLVCTRAAMSEAVPSWGVGVFRAQMTARPSHQDRAAAASTLLSLRFFGRCGMALVAIGLAGIAVQRWFGA